MARWYPELLGDETDLAALAQAFVEPPVRVFLEAGRYHLEASELETLPDPAAVQKAATAILVRVNGAMRLGTPSHQNVRLGPIHERRADGTESTSVFVEPATIRIRTRVFPPTIEGGVRTTPAVHPATRLAEIASRDEDAFEALDLWANEPHNWVNLNKVLEIVQSRDGLSLGTTSRRELGRFKHTANHEKAAGREARHARLGSDPPKDPMSVTEAEFLIGRVLEAWLMSLP